MTIQGLLLFLFVGIALLFAVVAAGVATVFLVELRRFERVRGRQASPRAEFLRLFLRRLKRIKSIGDVHHSYRTFFGVGVLKSSHLEEIDEFLQHAMRRIASDPQSAPVGRPEAMIESLQELLVANRRALDVERMCVPFSGTPEPEREMLQALLDIPAGEAVTLTDKINALARAIRFRHDLVERLTYERDRSVIVARWGCYGAMTLAVLSAILGFLCLGL
jgi:hypothetical protein